MIGSKLSLTVNTLIRCLGDLKNKNLSIFVTWRCKYGDCEARQMRGSHRLDLYTVNTEQKHTVVPLLQGLILVFVNLFSCS